MHSPVALLALLLACSTGPSPTEPPPTRPTPTDATAAAPTGGAGTSADGAHVDNDADFETLAFRCCGTPSATALVDAFTALTDAMAADDEAATTQAVTRLIDAATAAGEDAALSQDSRRLADGVAMGLRTLPGRSIEDLRAVLASVSEEVIRFARENQGGDHKVVSAWCPMAPGHWLQTGADIRNPYYGAEMLSCGTLEAIRDQQQDADPAAAGGAP